MSGRFAIAGWRAWYDAAASGWVLAAGACLAIGLVDGMAFWAFGMFVAPLSDEFGWTSADIALAVSLTLLLQAMSSGVAGRLVERFGSRRVVLLGAIGVAAAYVSLGWVQALWQFYVLLAVLAIFQSWVLYVPFTALITTWFEQHRATGLSIAMSGFNIGGLLFLPLLTELIERAGWRAAFVVVGILVLVLDGTLVALMRDSPTPAWSKQQTSLIRSGDRRGTALLNMPSAGVALRSSQFWLLSLGFACFYFAYLAFLYHGPQLLESQGVPSRFAALIFSLAAGSGLLVRLSGGHWLECCERHELVAGASVLAMVLALLVLTTGTSLPALTAFALLWGVGSGIAPTLEPILVGRIFGRKLYASLYGVLEGVGTVVAIPGPWAGGLMSDLTDSPTPVLLLYGGALIVSACCFTLLTRRLPRHAATGSSQPHSASPEVDAVSKLPEPARSGEDRPADDVLPDDVLSRGRILLRRLLDEGQAAARAGHRAEAYRKFADVVRLEPENEEGWLWRAATAADPGETIGCLERVLALNPRNRCALRGLETLRSDRAPAAA